MTRRDQSLDFSLERTAVSLWQCSLQYTQFSIYILILNFKNNFSLGQGFIEIRQANFNSKQETRYTEICFTH